MPAKVNDICVVKFTSVETITAKLTKVDGNLYTFKNTMILFPTQDPETEESKLSFAPYSPFTIGDSVVVDNKNIIYCEPASSDIVDMYNQVVSRILQPPKQKIIMP